MHRSIEQVQQDSARSWMSLPGVVGCAVGESGGKPSIIVMVNKKTPALIKAIPNTAEGYSVIMEETGTINALDNE